MCWRFYMKVLTGQQALCQPKGEPRVSDHVQAPGLDPACGCQAIENSLWLLPRLSLPKWSLRKLILMELEK